MTALHEVVPVDMVLHCPKCGLQHIDAPDQPLTVLEATLRANPLSMPAPTRWTNPPHRSHLCKSCGHIWRPADVPTNGVAAVATKGKADSPITAPVVPLTDEQFADIVADASLAVDFAANPIKLLAFAREVLKAHGIGGGK